MIIKPSSKCARTIITPETICMHKQIHHIRTLHEVNFFIAHITNGRGLADAANHLIRIRVVRVAIVMMV